VVTRVEWHAGELFPRVDLIVTNLKRRAKKVIRVCSRRVHTARSPRDD
jgi:hypothetical protein